MTASHIPDFTQANADLDELRDLSRLQLFDLFEFLRFLSEAGTPVMICEVDDMPTVATLGRVVRYKLSQPLLALLSALRARNLDVNEVERCAGGIGNRAWRSASVSFGLD